MPLKVAIGPSSFAGEDKTPATMLESAGIELIPNPFGRRLFELEMIAHIRDADGLIAGLEPLNRHVLSSAPKLKALARVGIGMDNVDLDAARQLNIKVSNTPDPPAGAVAELTLAALLALCRDLPWMNAALHEGKWSKRIGVGLSGRKALIIGYGRIGRRVGNFLRIFGAEVLVSDPFVEPETLSRGEKHLSLDAGLREADIVTLHAAGTETILGRGEFAKMREGVFLLNSARGELVDEDALIDALESGKVARAWFDAFWDEPYQGRLLAFDQVLLTPHAGTYTRQCRLAMETEAVENLLRDLGIER